MAIENLVRENILRLAPYSSARNEFTGDASVFLDANENSFGSPLERDWSRYPDPLQVAIKQKLAALTELTPSQVFVGNGSDEAIDLLFRIFCRPGIDNIVICPPTYGVYEVAAGINDVAVRRANLTNKFDLDAQAVLAAVDDKTKLVFICSPNNPTGNLLSTSSIVEIVGNFGGITVVDEAYIHFSDQPSLCTEIKKFPNLVVLQTFSKAWGLAGLRVGCAFAREPIIDLMNKVKPPYNVSGVAQELVLKALNNGGCVDKTVDEIVRERVSLAEQLAQFRFVRKVFRSDANFLLVKVDDADGIYRALLEHGIVVRNRSRLELCEGCLRITVGTPDQNERLLEVLEEYEKSPVH